MDDVMLRGRPPTLEGALVDPYCRMFDFIARIERTVVPAAAAISWALNDLRCSISLISARFDSESFGAIFNTKLSQA
jgi:hypothetical protein